MKYLWLKIKDFDKPDFEKVAKIKNIRKTQFFSPLGGVIPAKKPQPVEMLFVPQVRAEERGTKVFQIVSKSGNLILCDCNLRRTHFFMDFFIPLLKKVWAILIYLTCWVKKISNL